MCCTTRTSDLSMWVCFFKGKTSEVEETFSLHSTSDSLHNDCLCQLLQGFKPTVDVAQEVQRSPINQKIGGLIPGKMLYPKLLLMAAPTVYECDM